MTATTEQSKIVSCSSFDRKLTGAVKAGMQGMVETGRVATGITHQKRGVNLALLILGVIAPFFA